MSAERRSAQVDNEGVWRRSNFLVDTFAGKGLPGNRDGSRTEASFNSPHCVCALHNGSILISDTMNDCLRILDPKSNTVSTINTSGSKVAVKILRPMGVCEIETGKILVCDVGHNRIRKLEYDGKGYWTVSNFAGSGKKGFKDGPIQKCQFDSPTGIALLWDGSIVIADKNNHRIRRIVGNVITTVAGTLPGYEDGDSRLAKFHCPVSVAVAPNKTILVSDSKNHCIRRISTDFRTVSTVIGIPSPGYVDGSSQTARFHNPQDFTVASDGSILVADRDNNAIRKITISWGDLAVVSTWAGKKKAGMGFKDGPLDKSEFSCPSGICIDETGAVYITDAGNHTIRVIRQVTKEYRSPLIPIAFDYTNFVNDILSQSANENIPADIFQYSAHGQAKEATYSNLFMARQSKQGSTSPIRERTIMPLKVATPEKEKEKKPVLKKPSPPQEKPQTKKISPKKQSPAVEKETYDDIPLSASDFELIEQLQRDFSIDLPSLSSLSPSKPKPVQNNYVEPNYSSPSRQQSIVPDILQEGDRLVLKSDVQLFFYDYPTLNWVYVCDGTAGIYTKMSETEPQPDYTLIVFNRELREVELTQEFWVQMRTDVHRSTTLFWSWFTRKQQLYGLRFASEHDLQVFQTVAESIITMLELKNTEENVEVSNSGSIDDMRPQVFLNNVEEEEDLPPQEFLYRPKSPSKSVKTKGPPTPEMLQQILGNSIEREDSPVSSLPSRPVSDYNLAGHDEDFQELSVEFPIEVLVPKQHDNIIPEYDAAIFRILNDLQYEVPPEVVEKIRRRLAINLGLKLTGHKESNRDNVLNLNQLAKVRMQELVGDLLDLHPYVCNEMSSLTEYYDMIRKTMGEESVYLEWYVQDSRGEPLLNFDNCFLLPNAGMRDLRVMVFVMDKVGIFWLYRDLEAHFTLNSDIDVPVDSVHYIDHKQGVNLGFRLSLSDTHETTLPNLESLKTVRCTVDIQLQRKEWNESRQINHPLEISIALFEPGKAPNYSDYKDRVQAASMNWPPQFRPSVLFSSRTMRICKS